MALPIRAPQRRDEAIAQGHPQLALRDEDREALAELLAEALVAAFKRDRAEESA